jgi:hypothetical protein
LICRIRFVGDGEAEMPSIRDEPLAHEVLDEGYAPIGSPLGRPVYWRVVRRPDGMFYLSTFMMPRDQVIKGWGTEGLAHCDPVTGMAAVRIETVIDDDNWVSKSLPALS